MFIITKISLAASLIMLMALASEMLGILDRRCADIIMFAVLAIQTVFLAILITIFVMKKRMTRGIRIIRYQLHDTLVKGETDILPENMSPTNPRKFALFKIFLEIENVSEAPEIGISKTGLGRVIPDIKDHIVNINSGIVENNFIFDADVIVRPGEKINFHIKKDAIVKLFFLGEIYIP